MSLAAHANWLRALKGSLPQLLGALVAMFVLAALQLPAPLLTMRVLDVVNAPRPDTSMVPLFVTFLIALFFLKLGVTAAQRLILEKLRINIVLVVRRLMLSALVRVPLPYHLERSHGELLSRLEEDPHQIDQFLSDTVLTSVSDLLTLVSGIGLLFYINWRLAGVAIASIPVSAVLVFKLRRGMKQNVRELQDKAAGVSAFLAEILGNIVSVKTLALESWIERRYGDKMRFVTTQRLRIMRMRILYESLVACCSGLTPILILWYAAYGIAHRSMSVGEFVAFSGYLAYLYRPADSLIISVLNAQGAVNAAERVSALLGHPPEEIRPSTAPHITDRSFPGSIRFDGVYFRYDESTDWILRNVSCDISAGQITAIMGPSGSGKTSLVNLIPQLMQPNTGTVTIDGLSYASLTELRRSISLVSYDTLMFAGSVCENIAVGNDVATQAEVERAAQAACVEKWWLHGEQHESAIAEGGRSLSAGQRQRVLIARAILRNPSILILDEGTSCLDLATERRVIENLRGLSIPIIIVVSHRQSIRELADRVLYVSHGTLNDIEDPAVRVSEEEPHPSGVHANLTI